MKLEFQKEEPMPIMPIRRITRLVFPLVALAASSAHAQVLDAQVKDVQIVTSECINIGTSTFDAATGTTSWKAGPVAPLESSGCAGWGSVDRYANQTTQAPQAAWAWGGPPVQFDVIYGDLVTTTGTGLLDEVSISVANVLVGGPLLTGTFQIEIWDASDWPTYPSGYPTTRLASFGPVTAEFGDGLFPGNVAVVTAINIACVYGPAPIDSTNLLITHQMISHTGSPTYVGVGNFDPPTIGSSEHGIFLDTCCDGYNTDGGMMALPPAVDPANNGYRIALSCDPPTIAVDTSSLSFELPLGGFGSADIEISNLAECASLDWSVGGCPQLEGGQSGSVDVGGTQSFEFTLDTFGAAPGTYACNLLINSNASTPTVSIPVDYTVLGPIVDAAPGACYATKGTFTFEDGTDLVLIDPLTGVGAVAGNTRFALHAFAIDSTGRLFAQWQNATGNIYRLDANTGAMVYHTNMSPSNIVFEAWAFDSNDQLVGIADDGTLYEIDVDTGSMTTLMSVAPLMGGLTFDDASGLLYASQANTGPGTDNIYTIDIGAGTVTLLGNTGMALPIGDIAFDASGTLWGVVGEQSAPNWFVEVSPDTGVATPVSLTGSDDLTGLDFFKVCDPPTIAVDTSSLSFELPLGGFGSADIEISNLAECASLDWSVGGCPQLEGGQSGSIDAGEVQSFEFTLDTFGAAPGTYACNLLINSNDTETPTMTIPVDYTVLGPIVDAASGACYATKGTFTFEDGADLVLIDPLTGVGAVAGNTRFALQAFAIDSTGRLFAQWQNATGNIYRLDANTGALIFHANLSPSNIVFEAWAFDSNDQLVGIADDGTLYEIDVDTGSITTLMSVAPLMGGLTFDDASGLLYASQADTGPGTDNVYTIDIGAGTVTLLGNSGMALPIGDIAFDADGILWGVVGEQSAPNWFVEVSPDTGDATPISLTGSDDLTGLDFFNACLGDLDGSGDVGFADLLQVLSNWGPCVGCPQDIDGDSNVGFSDLLVILSNWGPCA